MSFCVQIYVFFLTTPKVWALFALFFIVPARPDVCRMVWKSKALIPEEPNAYFGRA